MHTHSKINFQNLKNTANILNISQISDNIISHSKHSNPLEVNLAFDL